MVPEVDEEQMAVIAAAMDPPRNADGLANVGSAELATIMGAIRVHGSAD